MVIEFESKVIFKTSGAISLKRQGINVSFVKSFKFDYVSIVQIWYRPNNNQCMFIYTLVGLAALEQMKIIRKLFN